MKNHLRISAHGKAFAERTQHDLRASAALLSGFVGIFDRSIAIQLGKRTLSNSSTDQTKYQASIDDGSIEICVQLISVPPEISAVFAQDGGHYLADTIVRLYKSVIAIWRGQSAPSNVPLGTGSSHVVGNDNVTGDNNFTVRGKNINISIEAFMAAGSTRPYLKKIAKHLKTGESVRLRSKNESCLIDNTIQGSLFGADKIDPLQFRIIGQLVDVDLPGRSGKIISDEAPIPVIVTWEQSIRSKVERCARAGVGSFDLRAVIGEKRFGKNNFGFRIIDCN